MRHDQRKAWGWEMQRRVTGDWGGCHHAKPPRTRELTPGGGDLNPRRLFSALLYVSFRPRAAKRPVQFFHRLAQKAL